MPSAYPNTDLRSSADRLAQHLVNELDLEGSLSPLRDGREHHLYRLHRRQGDLVLKFHRDDGLPDPIDPKRSWAARLLGEAIAIRMVQGVPVPTPYEVFLQTERPCALMPVLTGTTPEIHYEKGHLDYTGLMGVCVQMGRALAHIHTLRRPADGGGLPDLPGADLKHARLLHMDFHIGNVLGVPMHGWQITGVLDWTCARWGPPEADLVELQVSVFVANPRARDAFLTGYRQASGCNLNMADVEHRAKLEIQRRIKKDPPSPELRYLWEQWLSRTHA